MSIDRFYRHVLLETLMLLVTCFDPLSQTFRAPGLLTSTKSGYLITICLPFRLFSLFLQSQPDDDDGSIYILKRKILTRKPSLAETAHHVASQLDLSKRIYSFFLSFSSVTQLNPGWMQLWEGGLRKKSPFDFDRALHFLFATHFPVSLQLLVH